MAIRVLITGGTIDNLEYDSEDKAPKNQKSIIPDLIKKSRISLDYNMEEVCFKDSRFINEGDRELIFQKSKKCQDNNK